MIAWPTQTKLVAKAFVMSIVSAPRAPGVTIDSGRKKESIGDCTGPRGGLVALTAGATCDIDSPIPEFDPPQLTSLALVRAVSGSRVHR